MSDWPSSDSGLARPRPSTAPVAPPVTRYQLLDHLGSGGLGSVWRAERPDGTEVALKLLHSSSPSHVAQLKTEFRRMVDISHPNLAAQYELEEERGLLFFTMEQVDGQPWNLALTGADWAAIRAALRQLCAGVAALHNAGLIHFDLKPSNVLVQPDGRVVVLDFGLARTPVAPAIRSSRVRAAPLGTCRPSRLTGSLRAPRRTGTASG